MGWGPALPGGCAATPGHDARLEPGWAVAIGSARSPQQRLATGSPQAGPQPATRSQLRRGRRQPHKLQPRPGGPPRRAGRRRDGAEAVPDTGTGRWPSPSRPPPARRRRHRAGRPAAPTSAAACHAGRGAAPARSPGRQLRRTGGSARRPTRRRSSAGRCAFGRSRAPWPRPGGHRAIRPRPRGGRAGRAPQAHRTASSRRHPCPGWCATPLVCSSTWRRAQAATGRCRTRPLARRGPAPGGAWPGPAGPACRGGRCASRAHRRRGGGHPAAAGRRRGARLAGDLGLGLPWADRSAACRRRCSHSRSPGCRGTRPGAGLAARLMPGASPPSQPPRSSVTARAGFQSYNPK
jgi:hypothetical protein